MGNPFAGFFTKKEKETNEEEINKTIKRITAKPKSWHEILGVTQNCSEQELKTAYRRLVSKFHPDRFPSDQKDLVEQAVRKMTILNNAYQKGKIHLSLNQKQAEPEINGPAGGSSSNGKFKSKFE